MALRLRRGTDAERLTVVFPSGEPVWTIPDPQDPNDPVGNKLYVGDGTTVGGKLVGPFNVESDTNPTLSADLDLNGNNIVGTGNINIDGTITATGDITLGENTGQLVFSVAVTLTAGEVIIQTDANGQETARGTVQTGVAGVNIVPMKPMSAQWGLGGTYTNVGSVTGALPSIDSFTVSEDTVSVPGIINSGLRPGFDGQFDLGSNSRNWRNVYAKGADFEGEITADSIKTNYIVGPDSAIIYDSETNLLTSNVFGDVEGNILGADSSVIVDHNNGNINASDIACQSVTLSEGDTGLVSTSTLNSLQITDGYLQIITSSTFDDDQTVLEVLNFNDNTESSVLTFLRGRGTIEGVQSVSAGDSIQTFVYAGASSDLSSSNAVSLTASVDSAGTVSNGVVPGNIQISTTNDSGTEVVGLNLNRNGEITVADNTLTAGVASGEVDDSAAVSYLQITVGSTTYAMPLYAINP